MERRIDDCNSVARASSPRPSCLATLGELPIQRLGARPDLARDHLPGTPSEERRPRSRRSTRPGALRPFGGQRRRRALHRGGAGSRGRVSRRHDDREEPAGDADRHRAESSAASFIHLSAHLGTPKLLLPGLPRLRAAFGLGLPSCEKVITQDPHPAPHSTRPVGPVQSAGSRSAQQRRGTRTGLDPPVTGRDRVGSADARLNFSRVGDVQLGFRALRSIVR